MPPIPMSLNGVKGGGFCRGAVLPDGLTSNIDAALSTFPFAFFNAFSISPSVTFIPKSFIVCKFESYCACAALDGAALPVHLNALLNRSLNLG